MAEVDGAARANEHGPTPAADDPGDASRRRPSVTAAAMKPMTPTMARATPPDVAHATVADRLATMVAEWEPTGDRRAIFADAYGHMTIRMTEAIEADQFGDSVWVGRLLDGFADYYFVACDDHGIGGDGCPGVWRNALDACADDGTHPLQLLLLGINAHINHDLVFALSDVLDDWDDLTPPQRALRLDDHRSVNDVIGSTVDEVQDVVVARWSPGMGTLDRALGPLDEWVFSRMIAEWREDVWEASQRLLMAREEDRPDIERAIHERSQRTARLILAF